MCSRGNLRYLANADHGEHSLPNVSPETLETLRTFGSDRISFEQGLDYLAGRTFRQTLLCREDCAPADAPLVSRVPSLFASTALRVEAPVSALRGRAAVRLIDPAGRHVSLTDSFVKMSLKLLADAYPGSLRIDVLSERARGALAGSPVPHAPHELLHGLASALLRLYHADMVDLRLSAPTYATRAGERPEASALARSDIAARRASTTTLRHTILALDHPPMCELMALLDGTRDRKALLAALGSGWSEPQLRAGLEIAARSAVLLR
jgi:hypothetical protein